ncbi:Response regulator (modular protein) [Xanthomonas citri pv. fuscans]|nr:Response regulator (modular protein) [Xanthomonas citri pv. fuscans]SOO01517.1 Response regulator (modular protein) [Xanthomonas citri pv. fuscans]SOO03675.1 Response regulator (modular protein) [Xanthomonas citri pv. fuscans]SOO10082.1 Response regulator (modular protein) [Xanthomonas citri pv. fuscans]SOO14058.1 Response regulator (modular protein) [Xanthomonas citri pv. fuscans]
MLQMAGAELGSACGTRSAGPTARLCFARAAHAHSADNHDARVAAITQRWRLNLRCPHDGIHAALPGLPVSWRLSRSRLPGLFDERHARG